MTPEAVARLTPEELRALTDFSRQLLMESARIQKLCLQRPRERAVTTSRK